LDVSLASVILLCKGVCQSVVSVHVYVAWHEQGRSTPRREDELLTEFVNNKRLTS
jgi:hypothetical protein